MNNLKHATKLKEDENAPDHDIVEESDEESFPASDPPPWTLGVPHGKKPKDA